MNASTFPVLRSMWATSSSPASNFFFAAEASANSIEVKRYSLSMSFSRWRASMIRRISAPSMKGLLARRASAAAAGGPEAGARLFSFSAEPGAVPRGARGVDTNVEVRSNGQSAARPRSNLTFEPETKRSGQGPPLCAAPEKSREIVTRANRRGQPQRPFLWFFAAAKRAPSRAAALSLAGLFGALAMSPARATAPRSGGEHDRVDEVVARYV